MNKPNFLVLGAAKAGTSSLCHYLGQNPEVFIPEVKEPIFFDAEYHKGLDYYWHRYFAGWSGEPAVGEGRVFNLCLPFVPSRIKESLPEAKLIAVLRHPVDRAYSHWWHRFSYRDEDLPFGEAIQKNFERIANGILFEGDEGARVWQEGLVHPHAMATTYRLYLDVGLYAQHIRRYRDLFSPTQLKVLFYEDLRSDPQALVRDIWEFLGVRTDVELLDIDPQNTARTTRRSWLESQMGKILPGRDLLGITPKPFKRPASWLFREKSAVQPPMDPNMRQALIDYYRQANRELEPLVGRDLSAWNDSTIQGARETSTVEYGWEK